MQNLPTRIVFAGLSVLAASLPAFSAPEYHVTARYEIGGTGGYDYLKYEPGSHRLFVTHGTKVEVLDADTGRKLGEVAATPGVHGVAFAPELGCGFTTNGGDRTVTKFDLRTLATLQLIKYTGVKPDALVYDAGTKRVFIANGDPKQGGDLTVIDAASGAIVATVDLGGKLEDLALDGQGRLFAAAEDRGVIHVVDTRTLAVTAHWPIAPATEPTGMAIDRAHHRLFLACSNKMLAVVDTDTGRLVATPPIGPDPDGAAYDEGAGLAFASNRDGTLSVVRQVSADVYQTEATVPTGPGARTIAIDAEHHRLFVPTGKFSTDGRKLEPDSFAVLVISR